jgi:sec-independent protein translocase protein TatA
VPHLGPTELVIVLVILLILFGGNKLPKLARSLGTARKEFERGQALRVDDEAAEAR